MLRDAKQKLQIFYSLLFHFIFKIHYHIKKLTEVEYSIKM
jgi:hypothetical protein